MYLPAIMRVLVTSKGEPKISAVKPAMEAHKICRGTPSFIPVY